MMRVVVDTTVFVSPFFGGIPRKIIDLWKNGRILLCVPKPILNEYLSVLMRLGLENQTEAHELIGVFRQGTGILFTARTPNLKIVEKDPDDDKFIACAVALHASHIISGDKHLLAVEEYAGIRVPTPRQFLEESG
jgi:uncharacterized protein